MGFINKVQDKIKQNNMKIAETIENEVKISFKK